MRLLKKLLSLICFTRMENKTISLLPVIILLFSSFIGSAQITRVLRPHIYDSILKPNATVKVQTIENGRISETHHAAVNHLQVPVNSKTVLTYQKQISEIDAASYTKARLISQLPYSREEFKIIPELHVETRESQTAVYRIVFTLLQPFQYDDIQKKFNATLGFFLMPDSGNSTGNILEPVYIEVVSNDVTVIHPNHLQIPHLNLPSSRIKLMADQLNDSAEIKVITTSNPDGYIAYLKVKPTLEIFTNRSELQGYGIQKIPVEVRFLGSSSSDSVKVDFSVAKGSVKPNSIYVSYNKPSTIYLTSEGTGDAVLSAATNSVRSNNLHFTYKFPWPFLLFSILGGLIGGLAKYYLKQGRKKFSFKPIIGGILIGFIGAVAYYALGVNLLGVSISAGLNELAVLGFSALCTYFGISLLKLDGKN
jgi:hypothetical protein